MYKSIDIRIKLYKNNYKFYLKEINILKLKIKVILCNIILIFLVLLLGEYILYKIDNDGYPFIQFVNKVAYPPYNFSYKDVLKNEYYVYEPSGISYGQYRRPVLYNGNKKKPIILYGCSFAWGYKKFNK